MDWQYYVAVIVSTLIGIFIGTHYGMLKANRAWERSIPSMRKDVATRSRAVIAGQVNEQLAPYLPNFGHNPSEARFIGKPVDFIVFEGLDGKGVEEVVFVEVKTGSSRLSPVERSLKEAIERGSVRWEEYRCR